jgi:glycosyltransferase involved in cell wall biosynthesis
MGLKVCQLCAVDFTLKNFLLPLVDGMREEGWNVVAVCSDGPHIEELLAQGYLIKTIPIARSINPYHALLSLLRLTRYFRRESFDVLHVHTPVAALIGRIAAKLAGIPLVVYTAHGFYFHDHMPLWKRAFFVRLERIGGCLTNLLFCQSEEDAATAIHERIAPKSIVFTIGNGVDPALFDPRNVASGESVRSSLGIPVDAFVVGLIGRQVREKGICEFLEAMTSLAHRYRHLWVLLVGERLSSDHNQGVEKTIASAQSVLGHRLISLGSREDVPELLAAMDVFCLPSWREGMPRTIIEAMMMAKPVVATNIRGSREEVVSEQTGLLVRLRSAVDLAASVERIVLDPFLGRCYGNAGRARALRLFDENQVIAKQISHIKNELGILCATHVHSSR